MIKLMELGYATDALEPVMDKATVEIHHGKHLQTYVNNLNNTLADTKYSEMTLEEICEAYEGMDESLKTPVKNNGGGVINHNLYFGQFSANPKLTPEGQLLEDINKTFGSFEKLVEELKDKAVKRFGSGWSFLISNNGKLEVVSAPNQDCPEMLEKGQKILVAIDVWEHAYYLNYQNRRPEYLDNIFKIIDWSIVEQRYQ